MQPSIRSGGHKTGLRALGSRKLDSHKTLTAVLETFVSLYDGIQRLMVKLNMLRSGAKPLNELTLEGLYTKELEIFYFDFFDYKSWEKTKDTIRCLVTSIVISLAFYLMATYLMDLDLKIRIIVACAINTLLTLLLSFSPATRAVTFLMIPSMARGSLRSALLLGALVLLTAGPASNLRSNFQTISASKSCLHEQFFDIVTVVKSLRGKNLVGLFLIPIRLIIAAMKLVAEIFYRMVHAIYMALDKLIDTMKRLLKNIGKMLSRLRPKINFEGACSRVTREIAKKFRRTRLLGGFIQLMISLVNIVRSASGSTPIAKPTIGFFVLEIGTKKVCPLLKKAKEIYEEKKRKLSDWWQKSVLSKINEIKAVYDLITDAIGPDTRIVVTMRSGYAHKLSELQTSMRHAVDEKTRQFKETYSRASRVVQIVSTVSSLGVFLITVILSIHFYRKYMTADDFENNYVTAPFVRLDELEPPILPLDEYEKSRVSILAESMISDVARQLSASDVIIPIIRIVPFVIVILLNWIFYSMAYFLEARWNQAIKIERNVDTRLKIKAANDTVENSPMALLLTIMIHMQKALREVNMDINVLACSPKASEPNWAVDILIVLLLLMYTTFTLFGPFFLKLRHHIMLDLEPARSVQRAVWLRRQIESDRKLLSENRDILKVVQNEQMNSSIVFLYNTYCMEALGKLTDNIKSLFNMPTIRCIRCGVRGNLAIPNFNQFFTVCDSCEKNICAPCAHYTDPNGVVKLREICPNCGLKLSDVEIDAEMIDDEDPLDDMLFNFLDLRPGYKLSRSALKEHMKEVRQYAQEKEEESEKSFMNLLGKDALIDPNAK